MHLGEEDEFITKSRKPKSRLRLPKRPTPEVMAIRSGHFNAVAHRSLLQVGSGRTRDHDMRTRGNGRFRAIL
jgi:hypothetical protein